MPIYVEQHGRGPAILLAHGFAGSARNFRPQARALSGSHRVVLYDAPGHARTAKPPARTGDGPVVEAPPGFGLDDLVVAFGRVANALLGADPFVAGGLSLGAATALHFALARPERVRALVLASFPGGRGVAGSVRAGAAEFADAIERDGLEAAGARFVWGPESGLDPAAGRLVRQGLLEHPGPDLAALLRGALSELPGPDEISDRLAALRVPTLVVAGGEDPVSLDASRRLAGLVPGARFEQIAGAGHVVNLAKPAEFNALLLDFLAGLPT
ncbi:MAG: alpha/beta fold hydrolase [Myxococcota bacterium]